MTNMPTNDGYKVFAIVTAVVCIPFFVLIGSLNTNRGMAFWRRRTKAVFRSIGSFFTWLAGGAKSEEPALVMTKSFESQSSSRTDTYRLRRISSTQGNNTWKATRSTEIEEPTSREEELQKKMAEDGPPAAMLSPGTMRPVEPSSRIAEMWIGERDRRKKLRYREDV